MDNTKWCSRPTRKTRTDVTKRNPNYLLWLHFRSPIFHHSIVNRTPPHLMTRLAVLLKTLTIIIYNYYPKFPKTISCLQVVEIRRYFCDAPSSLLEQAFRMAIIPGNTASVVDFSFGELICTLRHLGNDRLCWIPRIQGRVSSCTVTEVTPDEWKRKQTTVKTDKR